MSLRATIWRLRQPPATTDLLLAALITALLPAGIAYLGVRLFPQGCDIHSDPALYRWTCLFPGLLITVPAIVAMVLTIAVWLNRRLVRPLPDGWLSNGLAAGMATHLVLIGGYFSLLDPAYRNLFLYESLFIPQPFIAGAVAGLLFGVVLSRRTRKG